MNAVRWMLLGGFGLTLLSGCDNGSSPTFTNVATGAAPTSSGGTNANSGGTAATADPASSGGTSATTNPAGSGGNSSSTTNTTPGQWHGCKASAVTDSVLASEYATWKAAYVLDCAGTDRGRVQAGGNNASSVSAETFSEGIGYGMLLAVTFNDQATLNKLWAYYKANRDTNGLMNWKMNACTTEAWGQNAASDGDLDSAMALVMADRKWGGYAVDTNALLDAIRQYETLVCGARTVLKPGDAWGDCSGNNLNPSYFAPGYYRAFAVYQTAQTSFWTKLADDAIALLLGYQQQVQGALMSEWGNASGTVADQSYGYNACRTPWRVAVDYAWWGTAGAQTFLTNVSNYVDQKGGVGAVPFDKNSAFLGPFALSGIATGKCDAYYQSWMTGAQYDNVYFQGTLRVLALALMAGKFVF